MQCFVGNLTDLNEVNDMEETTKPTRMPQNNTIQTHLKVKENKFITQEVSRFTIYRRMAIDKEPHKFLRTIFTAT